MADLLKYASEKGYHIMLNQVRKDNLASMRLHEKLGFESDGYSYRNQKNKEVFLYLKLL
ncbi:GNAT family N-acetyltransferase [Butyrivibrio fibrisolvens]|uniref:GNAT family N-acetyltransferase n=1 Tax=Butyrivibrio fibrisolvens TaxID=831 RepID=UPI0009D71FB0